MKKIMKLLKGPRLFLILAPFVLLSPVYLTGKAFFWGTSATQFVPWWEFAWKSILSGQLPFWNPLVGMGAPLVANYQSALFYPPTWIYFLVYLLGGVQWMAWSISIVVCIHLVWSGLGTAFLLEDLGVDEFGQVVGGLAFSLSGYLVARAGFLSINSTAAWVPWLLLFLYRLASGRRNVFPGLTGVLAMMLLAGHAQTAWMSVLFGGIWVIFWGIQKGRDRWLGHLGKAIVGYLAAGLLAASISAVQLLPTAEYLVFSQRAGEYGYESALTYSFWPWRLLTFLLPDLYGSPAAGTYWGYGNYWEDAVYIGLLPILLALGFLIRSLLRKKVHENGESGPGHRGLGIFLGGMVVFSFLLALGSNTPVFPFFYQRIPGFDLFQAPTRYTIIAVISLSILAGLGAHQLAKPSGRKLYFTRLAVAGCFSIVAGAVIAGLVLPDIRHTFLFSAGRAGLIGLMSAALYLTLPERADLKKNNAWRLIIILLIALDLVSAGWGLNPGVDKAFYVASGSTAEKGRFWMPAAIEYDLKFGKYFRFDTFDPGIRWEDMRQELLPNLPMLQGLMMVNNFDPMVPGYYQEWMDRINKEFPNQQILELMDVRAVIQINDAGLAVPVATSGSAGPVRLAGCAEIASLDKMDPGIVLESDADLLESMVVYSEKPVSCEPGNSGRLEIIEEANGYLKLEIDLEQDGWVFWSQTWYPGWVYRIDGGDEIQSYRVNYLFQGAKLKAGSSQVEFMYKPGTVIWGGVVSGVSLVIAVFILGRRRKNPQDQADRS